jgi:hypothetical protein
MWCVCIFALFFVFCFFLKRQTPYSTYRTSSGKICTCFIYGPVKNNEIFREDRSCKLLLENCLPQIWFNIHTLLTKRKPFLISIPNFISVYLALPALTNPGMLVSRQKYLDSSTSALPIHKYFISALPTHEHSASPFRILTNNIFVSFLARWHSNNALPTDKHSSIAIFIHKKRIACTLSTHNNLGSALPTHTYTSRVLTIHKTVHQFPPYSQAS